MALIACQSGSHLKLDHAQKPDWWFSRKIDFLAELKAEGIRFRGGIRIYISRLTNICDVEVRGNARPPLATFTRRVCLSRTSSGPEI